MCSGTRPPQPIPPFPRRRSPSPSRKPVDSSLLVTRLAHLIRSEKLDLSVLLANRTPALRPLAASSLVNSLPPQQHFHQNKLNPTLIPSNRCPTLNQRLPACAITTTSSSTTTPQSNSNNNNNNNPSIRQPCPIAPPTPIRMAARGSHWSFLEKARFEAALHRYGPFAWDRIIEAVGTRTEKQVKAYAARYRRRKRLAARMHSQVLQQSHPQHIIQHIMPSPMRIPIHQQEHVQMTIVPTQQPQQSLPRQPQPHHPQKSENLSPVAPPSQPPKQEAEPEAEPSTDWLAPEGEVDTILPPASQNVSLDDTSLFSGGLFGDNILGSTGEDTDPLSERASEEVDLLGDHAMGGNVMIEEEEVKPLLPDEDQEKPYTSDFLSKWLKT